MIYLIIWICAIILMCLSCYKIGRLKMQIEIQREIAAHAAAEAIAKAEEKS